MGKFFGTDGIRQKAEGFSPDFVAKIALGLVRYGEAQKKNGVLRVLLGGDTRESSEWIIRDFEKALAGLGAECSNVEVLATPGINYAFYAMGFDFAIDVTASHNPYTDNGVKIFERGDKIGLNCGIKLSAEGVEEIEKSLTEKSRQEEAAMTGYSASLHDDGLESYMGHLRDYIGRVRPVGGEERKVDFAGLKIGMDCANGATAVVAGKIFKEFGAEVVEINTDASYGQKINEKCGSTDLEEIKRLVKEKGLDFGVAFDGDGDRCLMVTSEGEEVDGDQIIALIADYLGLEAVVSTVMVNQGLLTWAEKQGVKVEITDVGDQNVAKAMREKGILIGGEQSGHVILPKESMGDGMLTALLVAKIISEKKADLSDLVITKTPQALYSIEVTKEEKAAFIELRPEVKGVIEKYEKQLKEEGSRLLVRASGTQNMIRVSIWGNDAEKITAEAKLIAEKIKTAGRK